MRANIAHNLRYAKVGLRYVTANQPLHFYPIAATVTAVVTITFFMIVLLSSGTLDRWIAVLSQKPGVNVTGLDRKAMLAILCLFYLVCYFIPVFFSAGLIARVLPMVTGRRRMASEGLRTAARRLPELAGWTMFSAVVCAPLRAIENAHPKGGELTASFLGSSWGAITSLLLPILLLDDAGPIAAARQSHRTVRSAWGKGQVPSYSVGSLSLLVNTAVALLGLVLVGVCLALGTAVGLGIAIWLIAVAMTLVGIAAGAADGVLRALLFNHATGRPIPDSIDRAMLAEAFRPVDGAGSPPPVQAEELPAIPPSPVPMEPAVTVGSSSDEDQNDHDLADFYRRFG